MRRIRAFILYSLLLLSMFSVAVTPQGRELDNPALQDEELPLDPEVRIGRLENGLTYYIRKNAKPEDRAELRLVVNAGSILEEENQLGLAHFAEHMAFNGTKKYERHELVDYIESIGMRFGPELNAYTSFDETVYMLQVPTDSLEMLYTGLEILREWAANVTYEDEEIDKERGVVIEEWRQGRGADARIRDRQLPVLLQGSRYATRLPIGSLEILQSFPYEVVKQFYHDWYRPDLMAVVAVGDFDPDDMETRIRDLFSTIAEVENHKPREVFELPGHQETLVAIATDPEAVSSSVSIIYKHPGREFSTLDDYRQRVVDRLYHGMFNARLQELVQSTDPPFIYAGSGSEGFGRSAELYNLYASVREDEFLRALETLLVEAERVERYGFTASEFEREKAELLRGMERAFNEKDKTESRVYASEYVNHFLEEEPIPGIAYEFEQTRELLPTISLDEVNQVADRWITEENRVILVDGPEKEDLEIPTKEELLAVFEAVSSREITPFEDKVSEEPLLSQTPTAGSILDEQYNESLGVTRLILSNGVEVVLKPTDFKNDEILFSGRSPGGISLVSDDVYDSARYASVLIGQSGVGKFGPIELQKKLSGKIVRVSPVIGVNSEGFSGSASPEDVETLFQLVHLYFTEPRADSVSFISFQKRLSDYLANMKANPESAFQDTLLTTLSQNHPRRQPVTAETLNEIDLETAFRIYQDRFEDASDFTFYLVGNFDVATLKPMIETYLGSLPSTGREEVARDEGVRPPEGVIRKEVYRGLEPKSRVEIVFTGPFEWSLENRLQLGALADVLSIKLREVLREDMGGTYGVGVNAYRARIPTERYNINIGFGTDPNRVDDMVQTIFAQIDSLQNHGISEKYLAKVRETDMRQHQESLKENRFWLASLEFYDEHREDPVTIIRDPSEFLDRLTSAMIQESANKYLNEKNFVQVVLYPEGNGKSTQ